MFQLSMNWHFSVILSTISWKFGGEGDFCYNFFHLLLSLQWSNLAKLVTTVCSSTLVGRPKSVLVTQPGQSTVDSS